MVHRALVSLQDFAFGKGGGEGLRAESLFFLCLVCNLFQTFGGLTKWPYSYPTAIEFPLGLFNVLPHFLIKVCNEKPNKLPSSGRMSCLIELWISQEI